MDVDAVLDSKMKDQIDLVSNGTDCNGQASDSDLPPNSLRDKLKGNMDGFGIMSRNGTREKDLSENGDGVDTNGVNGDDATNGSEEHSIDDQNDDLSSVEGHSNDDSGGLPLDEDSKAVSMNEDSAAVSMNEDSAAVSINEDSTAVSVNDDSTAISVNDDSTAVSINEDDSKGISIDEDSKSASLDDDSNAASVVTGSRDQLATSQEELMDVDKADITDDKSNDSSVIESGSVRPSSENTKDSTANDGLSNNEDKITNSNENTNDTDTRIESPKKDDDTVEKQDVQRISDKTDSKSKVMNKEDSSKDKNSSKAVVIEDSPVKASKKTGKPSKVDRVLANDKSQGSSSSGAENLRPFARLLFDVGLDLTRQQVYKDLIRVQSKKQNHNKLNEKEGKQLDKLKEAYTHLIDKNKCFHADFHKCSKCNYKTDTINVMAYHKEFDHKGSCSLCDFVTGNASAFYFHMEAEHNRQGRVEPMLGMFVCPHCPYEHHSARKNFIKHLAKCEKAFDLKRNLQPMPADCDIPLKPAPVSVQAAQQTVRGVRQPPPLVRKPQVPVAPVAPTARNMAPSALGGMRPTSVAGQTIIQQGLPQWLNVQDNQAPQLVQMGGQYFLVVNQNGQTFMTPMTSGAVPGVPPGAIPNVMPVQQPVPPAKHVAKQPTLEPKPAPMLKQTPKGAFEICEICGGFVKDRDSLRIHFFWAHKIEIHPSLMKAREPALNCNNASCQRRFWTYQGYQRHVTVAHGGEVSKASSPGMTCYVCGINTVDFITHMTAKHPQVVKHMLSQMRCVVCQDALPTETALESHMFIEHKDVVTKYGSLVGGINKNNTKKTPEKTEAVPMGTPVPNEEFQKQSEIGCSRCEHKFSSSHEYGVHFSKEHAEDTEPCVVCKDDVQVGNPFIHHVKEKHLKGLSIPVIRISKETIEKSSAPVQVSRKRKSSEEVIVIDLDDKKRQKLDETSEQEEDKDIVKEKDQENIPEEDSKKVIEEIIEVDGEQVVIQKMIE